ncbi:hypothetical protein FI667_g15092, partial [Globisporangium splendens]
MRTQHAALVVIFHRLLVAALLIQGDVPPLSDPPVDAAVFARCQEKPQSSFPVYSQPLQLVGMLRGYSAFKTLFTRPSIDHNLDATSFQMLSSKFEQLLRKYADGVDWLDGGDVPGCRKWFPRQITSEMTYAQLTTQLEVCTCSSLRYQMGRAVANFYACALQTAADPSSLHHEYAAKVRRLNFLHRKRVGLVGGRAMLTTYDALFDRCIMKTLEEDVKRFSRERKNVEPSNLPPPNPRALDDSSATIMNTESLGGKLLWAIVCMVPAGLFTALLVLMERHIRHQNPRWRPLLQCHRDSNEMPSDDTSPTAALLQQPRVAPELLHDSVADLVTNTIAPRRGSTDLAASVNHPD